MDENKELLLKAGARLYSLGLELEAARQRLKNMVADGVAYQSPQMLAALQDAQLLDRQWKQLEKDYLELQQEVLQRF